MKIVIICALLTAMVGYSQSTLLLSEICVRPTEAEFIEVYNPNGSAVSLSDYYLCDLYGDNTKIEQFYPYMVTGTITPQLNGDFLVKFPAGASIPAGGTIVIAMDGAAFYGEYGFAPDYDVKGSGTGMAMEIPSNGFAGSNAGLNNGAEVAMLFYWDGSSDLVLDADYVQWGIDGTRRIWKTGISLDGPDAGTTPSVYLDDTEPYDQDTISPDAHLNGESYQRIDFTEGTEVKTGGNGIGGHDETSENLSVTWTTATAGPGEVETALDRSTWAGIKTAF
jgi:hypothetical protein